FRTSYEKARELYPMAEDILRFCAFLQPDSIPEELFEHDESFMQNSMAFNKGIASLLQYSLMKHNRHERTWSLHRLLQAVLIEDMPPDLQKQWRERVVRALKATYSSVDFSRGRLYKLLLLHLLACAA